MNWSVELDGTITKARAFGKGGMSTSCATPPAKPTKANVPTSQRRRHMTFRDAFRSRGCSLTVPRCDASWRYRAQPSTWRSSHLFISITSHHPARGDGDRPRPTFVGIDRSAFHVAIPLKPIRVKSGRQVDQYIPG